MVYLIQSPPSNTPVQIFSPFGLPRQLFPLLGPFAIGTPSPTDFGRYFLPKQGLVSKCIHPVCLACYGTYFKYFANCLCRVRCEGEFWRGTNKCKQTCDRPLECRSPSLVYSASSLAPSFFIYIDSEPLKCIESAQRLGFRLFEHSSGLPKPSLQQ